MKCPTGSRAGNCYFVTNGPHCYSHSTSNHLDGSKRNLSPNLILKNQAHEIRNTDCLLARPFQQRDHRWQRDVLFAYKWRKSRVLKSANSHPVQYESAAAGLPSFTVCPIYQAGVCTWNTLLTSRPLLMGVGPGHLHISPCSTYTQWRNCRSFVYWGPTAQSRVRLC